VSLRLGSMDLVVFGVDGAVGAVDIVVVVFVVVDGVADGGALID
jgi:hypothetical protein